MLLCTFGSQGLAQPAANDAVECTAKQTAFRVRAGFDVSLNADSGWAGALNESVSVDVDQPFRIRFELEVPTAELEVPTAETEQLQFQLQYRRNQGAWTGVAAEDFPKPEEASPRVSIVSAASYDHGQATLDSLSFSKAAYYGGIGVSLSSTATANHSGNNERFPDVVQCEWEWPLVIRRFADGAVRNDTGDRFEFRMIGVDDSIVGAESVASVMVRVPPRHVGGTFVETPGRIGPWEAANGDLYFIMEPAESDNLLMIVKSENGGRTWQEVDSANRPVADDLEGVASVVFANTIHVLHQTSDAVWYHAFNMSDHTQRPDTWSVRDELVAKPEEPPVQVTAIAARSDGSLVGLYGGPAKIHIRIRSPEGIWGSERVLDEDRAPNLSGPQAVAGNHDTVHMAYTGNDGTAWYRRLQSDGSLTPRVQITDKVGVTEHDVGSILPLVFLPETNTVVIVYRLTDGHLWERRSLPDGSFSKPRRVSDRRVIQNAVDSDQTGADAIADGTKVHVLFIAEKSGEIYWTSAAGNDDWSPALLQVSDVRAEWIRGTHLHRGGKPCIGFIYDAGSGGGAGMNRFDTVPVTKL